jgi:hypothetical protein
VRQFGFTDRLRQPRNVRRTNVVVDHDLGQMARCHCDLALLPVMIPENRQRLWALFRSNRLTTSQNSTRERCTVTSLRPHCQLAELVFHAIVPFGCQSEVFGVSIAQPCFFLFHVADGRLEVLGHGLPDVLEAAEDVTGTELRERKRVLEKWHSTSTWSMSDAGAFSAKKLLSGRFATRTKSMSPTSAMRRCGLSVPLPALPA